MTFCGNASTKQPAAADYLPDGIYGVSAAVSQ
jgi:hypothetical protein